MSRHLWTFALLLVASCSRRQPPPPATDSGSPAVPDVVLATYDALAALAIPSYPARLSARLLVANATSHESAVALPAGLVLRIVWETRDDLLYARRYLTHVRAKVERVEEGTCNILKTRSMASLPAPTDSLRVDLSIEYVCSQTKSMTTLSVPIGGVTDEGFTKFGPATGTPQPRSGPPLDPPVLTLRFGPASTTLDPPVTEALDAAVKLLRADKDLTLCVAAADARPNPRLDAVVKYFADHSIAAARIERHASKEPAPDTLELWPREPTCARPKRP